MLNGRRLLDDLGKIGVKNYHLAYILDQNRGQKLLKNVRKCYFCQSFQNFCEKIRQVIKIKGCPHLSTRFCLKACREFIILCVFVPNFRSKQEQKSVKIFKEIYFCKTIQCFWKTIRQIDNQRLLCISEGSWYDPYKKTGFGDILAKFEIKITARKC